MTSFILRRLGQLLITLVGISIISWVVITQAPGSPIALTMDPKVSPKVIEQMMKNYDLDKPIYQQYFLWLKKLFTGRLYSFKDGRPVLEKIEERIWNTLLLNLVATLIIFSLSDSPRHLFGKATIQLSGPSRNIWSLPWNFYPEASGWPISSFWKR